MRKREPESPSIDTAGADDQGSVGLILGYARAAYDQQFSRLDAFRARSGGLLAFAAALVALSSSVAPSRAPGLTDALGTGFVLAAAVLFLVASSGYRLRATPSARALARFALDAPPRGHHSALRLI